MKHYGSITELTAAAKTEQVQGAVFVQIAQVQTKATKTGKPYLEVTAADTDGSMSFKVWDNAPWFPAFVSLTAGAAVEVSGNFAVGQYGVEAADLDVRPLNPEEEEQLLSGSPELIARQQTAWEDVQRLSDSVRDPRLHALCRLFLDTFAARFRRSGAARKMHHARRGGLVEHTAGVMRAADALCTAYPQLNRDLVLTGALFHDSGKMWENGYEEHTFVMPFSPLGELMGHITMGIELVNKLWGQLMSEHKEEWKQLTPASEQVRLHLLHLVASHHGTLEFGSPVVPKTPEALALHHADDVDAKMEMFRASYGSGTELSDQVLQGRYPQSNVVKQLPSFE